MSFNHCLNFFYRIVDFWKGYLRCVWHVCVSVRQPVFACLSFSCSVSVFLSCICNSNTHLAEIPLAFDCVCLSVTHPAALYLPNRYRINYD